MDVHEVKVKVRATLKFRCKVTGRAVWRLCSLTGLGFILGCRLNGG